METLLKNFVFPIFERIGTGVAVTALGYGASAAHADGIAVGVTAVLGFAFDFGMNYIIRKRNEAVAVDKAVQSIGWGGYPPAKARFKG